MNTHEYQQKVLRTLAVDTERETLAMCALGLAGESGEVADILKKYLFHRQGKPLDVSKIVDEAGDIMWYLSALCSTLGVSLDEVMERNITKLEQRHHINGTQTGFVSRYSSDSGTSE